MTEIDVERTLKDKLNVDFRPYKILGACNPLLSHRALLVEPGIGLLLPCNVVVEAGPSGGSRISFLDPEIALGLVGNPELEPIAKMHRSGSEESPVAWLVLHPLPALLHLISKEVNNQCSL